MASSIFGELAALYRPGVFTTPTVFYFSLDEEKKTLTLGPEGCTIEEGKTVEEADCVCKTSAEFLGRVWNEGYRPGPLDFMSGKIKSNAPQLLLKFMEAFGK
ncbi:MAG: hypothetical protein ACOYM2_12940 [Rectinemataceae bacterium]